MTICLSLSIAFALSWFCGKAIKKHANVIYVATALISIAVTAIIITDAASGFPAFISKWIWPIFSNGALATAIFIIVMYTGTLRNGSAAMKRLMPVRAELSIIASILTLAHNIGFGRVYFIRLFTVPEQLPATQLLAAICSLILIAIMLPLFITSFPAIRKKIAPRSWKRLQRFAYAFYGLIYIHVMLLNVPMYQKGNTASAANIIIYSILFFGYAALRLRKALLRKQPKLVQPALAVCAALAICTCVISCIPRMRQPEENAVPETAAVAYMNGSYFGTGKGFNGDITLAVRIHDGAISGITIVSHSEDGSYFDKAHAVIDEVIATQSVDVDAISGATYSSNGIKEAISNALESAKVTE